MINAEERISKLERQTKRLINHICCEAPGPSEAVWGSITGDLSNQTDLNAELAATAIEIAGIQASLTDQTIELDAAEADIVTLQGDITTINGTLATKENALTFNTPLSRSVNTISITDAAADGATKGVSTFAATDFNAAAGVISIDYANGQAASASLNGFMTNGAQTFAGVKTFNNSIGIGTSPSSLLDINTNNLGVTQSNTSGITIVNNTAAAAGAQQISPALVFRGQGWKTTATAASQTVEFQIDVLPIQGSTSPTGTWRLKSSVNGAAYTDRMTVNTAGTITVAGNIVFGTDNTFTIGTAGANRPSNIFTGNLSMFGNLWAENGTYTVLGPNGGSSFSLFRLGGTTSSFPALKRSSTTLQVRLADDSGFGPLSTGLLTINGIQEFADNAAAITGGLTTGQVYRTGDALKIVH